MKRYLLVAWPLLFSSVAFGQPDPNAPGIGANPPEAPMGVNRALQNTPLDATRYFLNSLNKDWEPGFTMAVAGARVGFYGEEDWEKARLLYPFTLTMHLKVDDITVDSQTDDEAKVTVTAHTEFPAGEGNAVRRGNMTKYALQLHREEMPHPGDNAGQKVWRVVPLPIETVLTGSLFELPPLPLIATLAMHDSRLLPVLRQQLAMNQLKQLGLGVMQFVQDYDEVYALNNAAHERALLPYIKAPQLFTIVSTKDEKWRFNDNLSGEGLAAVAEPARTVLLYDGASPDFDHLNFRFGDKTLICFADGHVKALAKDELKDVLWKP